MACQHIRLMTSKCLTFTREDNALVRITNGIQKIQVAIVSSAKKSQVLQNYLFKQLELVEMDTGMVSNKMLFYVFFEEFPTFVTPVRKCFSIRI